MPVSIAHHEVLPARQAAAFLLPASACLFARFSSLLLQPRRRFFSITQGRLSPGNFRHSPTFCRPPLFGTRFFKRRLFLRHCQAPEE